MRLERADSDAAGPAARPDSSFSIGRGPRVSSPSGPGRLAGPRLAAVQLRRSRGRTLGVVALPPLLPAAGLLFSRGLSTAADYDESVYIAAVDAMRHGQQLGHHIFTAQPPGFYYLLAAGDAILGNTLRAVRTLVLLLAVLACLSAYLVG